MSTDDPLLRRASDTEASTVEAGEGLSKAVLLGEPHGAPNVALRRFTLASGGRVPRHTNEVEHEQYVLSGEYVVGLSRRIPERDGEATAVADGWEYTVRPGDAVHIPAGAIHWYRNEGDDEGSFVCAVPTGDDEIQLIER